MQGLFFARLCKSRCKSIRLSSQESSKSPARCIIAAHLMGGQSSINQLSARYADISYLPTQLLIDPTKKTRRSGSLSICACLGKLGGTAIASRRLGVGPDSLCAS